MNPNLEMSDLDFGGSMLNRFSPHIKGVNTRKRVSVGSHHGACRGTVLMRNYLAIHPYGAFKTHLGL